MLFNSFEFLIFLAIVFLLYWFVFHKNLKVQNTLLLVVSYIFYGWWDWRFLSLILISSLFDYFVGLLLGNQHQKNTRKLLIIFSIIINIGFLGFFKYYNFFIDSFTELLSSLNFQPNKRSLNIILPVGISFYTFQSLSYSIDVYKNKLRPTKDVIEFLAYVSFFPQLVAGPIERAIDFLPQFSKTRIFDFSKATDGLRQMLWGFFKKVVLADTCAVNANYIFDNSNSLSGGVLFLGTIYFAFQIYGDFSGYSDIAIGSARLFGFNIRRNFAYPYFSRDIAEFWRRWHISLSSWFRDYVYIPIGGSFGNKLKRIRNILIVFTLSGFWHGANWTFIFWGLLNGLYYIPLLLSNKIKQKTAIVAEKSIFPSIREFIQVLFTFLLISFTWIFFRAQTLGEAFMYIKNIFANGLLRISILDLRGRGITPTLIDATLAIFIVVVLEWFQRRKQHALEFAGIPVVVRWGAYWIITFICLFYFGEEKTFIYFQF